jgi:hypothetical protein
LTQVAPLLAAGLSARAIARETGIPVSAVQRAKCRIKKATADRAAASVEPSSYVTRRTIDGVPYDGRSLTTEVYERKVSEAIGRGLLHPDKCDDPGDVVSALFAACFMHDSLHWLCRRGFVEWSERGKAEAIIAGVNELAARLER